MEVWKDIPGYKGMYQVSNYGNIKRLFRNGKERPLVGRADRDGYIEVILSKNQSKSFRRVHRLVAEVFVPNPMNKPQVNHKDRDKRNNSVYNLEWVTAKENTVHCVLTGRNAHKRAVDQYTQDMVFVSDWECIREASKNLDISEHNICSCCNGKLKTAGGYIWKYKEAE